MDSIFWLNFAFVCITTIVCVWHFAWLAMNKNVVQALQNAQSLIAILWSKVMRFLIVTTLAIFALVSMSTYFLMQIFIDLGGYGLSAWAVVVVYAVFHAWIICKVTAYRLLYSALRKHYPQ